MSESELPLKATCELRYFPTERALVLSTGPPRGTASDRGIVGKRNSLDCRDSAENEGPPRAAVGSRQFADEALFRESERCLMTRSSQSSQHVSNDRFPQY